MGRNRKHHPPKHGVRRQELAKAKRSSWSEPTEEAGNAQGKNRFVLLLLSAADISMPFQSTVERHRLAKT
jgi:hypothetical protein